MNSGLRGTTSDETANGDEALDINTFHVNSDLDKAGDVEGKGHLDKKGYGNDKDKEGAIGRDGKQASDNMFDMNAAKGYSDKSSEVGAMVGDYKNYGGAEVEMIDRNDLGLGARDDIDKAIPDTDEIGRPDKGKKQKNKKENYNSTAYIAYINKLHVRRIVNKILNRQSNSLLDDLVPTDEIDQEVMEIVIEFCKYRIEFCSYDLEKMKTVKTMLTEEERERLHIPKGAIPTMKRPMEPSGKIPKPKRFYADSSFYIFSFWLYLCLRFLRKRLNEVLQEIDNKPNDDAQV